MSLMDQGLEALRRGDFEAAQELFSRAVADGPLNEAAYEGLAEALHQLGHSELALRVAENAIEDMPKSLFLHRKSVAIYRELGDHEGAERAAERYVLAFDELSEAWLTLGDVRAKAGRVDQALRAYQFAHERDDNDWQAWHRMGLVHEKKGDLRSACVAFRNAAGIAPDNHRPLRALARCLQALGKRDEAQEAIAQAIALAEAEGRAITH